MSRIVSITHATLIATLVAAAALCCSDGTAPPDPVTPVIGGTYPLERASDESGEWQAIVVAACSPGDSRDSHTREAYTLQKSALGLDTIAQRFTMTLSGYDLDCDGARREWELTFGSGYELGDDMRSLTLGPSATSPGFSGEGSAGAEGGDYWVRIELTKEDRDVGSELDAFAMLAFVRDAP